MSEFRGQQESRALLFPKLGDQRFCWFFYLLALKGDKVFRNFQKISSPAYARLLTNPTYEESVPFASQSEEMVDIFLHEKTKPTFRMTLEGATDFQKKLFERLSPFYSQLDT